ncbi:MAG: cadherin repeat domain-containing protein, partial [Betaproteobacteria bacterium]|nr:cadherin repeat domain-containing protein [Betaproteobacteria bacterium]
PYLITLQVHDNEPSAVRGRATVTVQISIDDINERPNAYAADAFGSSSHNHTQIVVTVNNSQYHAQFGADDRASLLLAYASGGTRSTMNLPGVPASSLHQTVTIGSLAPDSAYTLSLRWKSADSGSASQRWSAQEVVTTDANRAPVFTGGASVNRSLNESVGTDDTAVGTAVGAPIVATDADGDTIAYTFTPDSDDFSIDAAGQIKVKRAANFNFEQSPEPVTLTVAASDGVVSESPRQQVIINIANIVEDPENYSDANFRQDGQTRIAVTLKWNNKPYLDQFAAEDRGSVALGWYYDEGTIVNEKTTVAITQTVFAITVKGSQPFNNFTVTLRFFSKDGSSGTANYEITPNLDPNAAPVFTASSLTPSRDENSGTAATTDEGVTLAMLLATDADNDALAFSKRPGLDGALFGVKTSGEVTLKTATNFNKEVKDKYTLNVRVSDGVYRGSANGQLVLSIDDIAEPPVFAAASFPRQLVSSSAQGDFTFHAATDPNNPDDATAISYVAQRINSTSDLAAAGVEFTAATRRFVVAAGSSAATLTIRVTASDSDTDPEQTSQQFILEIVDVGIDAPESAALSRETRSSVLPVKLVSAPVGTGEVTLALSSATAAEVDVSPAQLVFTRTSWQTVQNATVTLKDAALSTKNMRTVKVMIAVDDASNTNYASGVTAAEVDVAVDLLNRAPAFTADERTRSIEEGDYAASDPIGDPIAAGDSDNPAGDLTHSLVGTSQLFAVSAAGQLSFKAATSLDHETTDSYKVTLKVDDGETANIGRATVTVAIMVTDINE